MLIDSRIAAILAHLGADAIRPLLERQTQVSVPVAAKLTGHSEPRLRIAASAGELGANGYSHARIGLDTLAAWAGRQPYDADELAAAFRRLTQRSQRAASSPKAGNDGRGLDPAD